MNFFKKNKLISALVLISTALLTPSFLPAMPVKEVLGYVAEKAIESSPESLERMGTAVAIAATTLRNEVLNNGKTGEAAVEEHKRSTDAQHEAELLIGRGTIQIQGISVNNIPRVAASIVGDHATTPSATREAATGQSATHATSPSIPLSGKQPLVASPPITDQKRQESAGDVPVVLLGTVPVQGDKQPTQDAQPFWPQLSPNAFFSVTTNTPFSRHSVNQINKQNKYSVGEYGRWSVEQFKGRIHSMTKKQAYACFFWFGLPNFMQALGETYPEDHKQSLLALQQTLEHDNNYDAIAHQTVFTCHIHKNKVKIEGTGKTLKKVVAQLAASAPEPISTATPVTPTTPQTQPQPAEAPITTTAAPPPVEPPPGKKPDEDKHEESARLKGEHKAPQPTQPTNTLTTEQIREHAKVAKEAEDATRLKWKSHINVKKHSLENFGATDEEKIQKIVEVPRRISVKYGRLAKGPHQVRTRINGKVSEVKFYVDKTDKIINVDAFQGQSDAKPDKVHLHIEYDLMEDPLLTAQINEAAAAAQKIMAATQEILEKTIIRQSCGGADSKPFLNTLVALWSASAPKTEQEKKESAAKTLIFSSLAQMVYARVTGSSPQTTPTMTAEQERKRSETVTAFTSALKQVLHVPTNGSSQQPTATATTGTTQSAMQQKFVENLQDYAQLYAELREQGRSIIELAPDRETQRNLSIMEPILQAIANQQKTTAAQAKDAVTTTTIPVSQAQTSTTLTVVSATAPTPTKSAPTDTSNPAPTGSNNQPKQPESKTAATTATSSDNKQTATQEAKPPVLVVTSSDDKKTESNANASISTSTASLLVPTSQPQPTAEQLQTLRQTVSHMQASGMTMPEIQATVSENMGLPSTGQQHNFVTPRNLVLAITIIQAAPWIINTVRSLPNAFGLFYKSYNETAYPFAYDDDLSIHCDLRPHTPLEALNAIEKVAEISSFAYIFAPIDSRAAYHNQEQLFDDLMNRLRQLSLAAPCPYRAEDNKQFNAHDEKFATLSRLEQSALYYANQLCTLEQQRTENARNALNCFQRIDQGWWNGISRRIIPDIPTARRYLENCLNAYYGERAIAKLYTALKETLLGQKPIEKTYTSPKLPSNCQQLQATFERHNGTPIQHYVHTAIAKSARKLGDTFTHFDHKTLAPICGGNFLIVENIHAFHLYLLECAVQLNRFNRNLEALAIVDFCNSYVQQLSNIYLDNLDRHIHHDISFFGLGKGLLEMARRVGHDLGVCNLPDVDTNPFGRSTNNIKVFLEDRGRLVACINTCDDLIQSHRNLLTQFAHVIEYTSLNLNIFNNLVLDQAQRHIDALQRRDARSTENAVTFINTLIFANEQKQATTTQTTEQLPLPQILSQALTNEARNEQRAVEINANQQELELWGPVRRILKDVLIQLLQNAQARRTQYAPLLRAEQEKQVAQARELVAARERLVAQQILQQQLAAQQQRQKVATQAPTVTVTTTSPAPVPTNSTAETKQSAQTASIATATTQSHNPTRPVSSPNKENVSTESNANKNTVVTQLGNLLTGSQRVLAEEPADLTVLLNNTPQPTVSNPTKQALANLLEQSRTLRDDLAEIDTALDRDLKTANAT